jgi:hypothetical protein
MPVFLTPDVRDGWLSPEKLTDEESALAMLEHVEASAAKTAPNGAPGSVIGRVPVTRRASRLLHPQGYPQRAPAAA